MTVEERLNRYRKIPCKFLHTVADSANNMMDTMRDLEIPEEFVKEIASLRESAWNLALKIEDWIKKEK